jgi:hypothetical protein
MKIKTVQQLVDIVSPNKIKGIQLLPKEPSYTTNLYQSLALGKLEKQNFIDQPESFLEAGLSHKKFDRVKRELFDRLINLLFLIDSNKTKYKEVKHAYSICYKNASAVKILLSKGARLAAISLAERTLKISSLFEFTEISLSLCIELMIHYGNIEGNKKKYSYYQRKTTGYQKVYNAEIKAELYNSEIGLHLSGSRAYKQEGKELAYKYSKELEELIRHLDSYKLNLFTFNLIALSNELSLRFNEVIESCNKALVYFENKKYKIPRNALFLFQFRKIPSLILLDHLIEAEETSKDCLKYVSVGYNNWYKILELRFIIFMHLREFDRAYDTYNEVISNKSFTKQYPDTQEVWYIYEAYMYYFYIKKAICQNVNERLKKFRVHKFLNEVPSYSKDKQGLNIAILILQVLLLLYNEEYGKIIDRTEALRTYAHRYLRKDETFRSNCFIKMLMQLPAAHFHKAAVIRKTELLVKKLNSVKILNNQSAEVEAIPYEVLWEFVLGSLDNKVR